MTSAKNIYLLLARDITTDSADNMNSIIKIIDRVSTSVNLEDLKKSGITRTALEQGKSVGAIPYNYSIGTLWLFDKTAKMGTKLKFRLGVKDPAGIQVTDLTQEYTLPQDLKRLALNFNMASFPFTKAGTYTLSADLLQGENILGSAEYPYTVDIEWLATEDATDKK